MAPSVDVYNQMLRFYNISKGLKKGDPDFKAPVESVIDDEYCAMMGWYFLSGPGSLGDLLHGRSFIEVEVGHLVGELASLSLASPISPSEEAIIPERGPEFEALGLIEHTPEKIFTAILAE